MPGKAFKSPQQKAVVGFRAFPRAMLCSSLSDLRAFLAFISPKAIASSHPKSGDVSGWHLETEAAEHPLKYSPLPHPQPYPHRSLKKSSVKLRQDTLLQRKRMWLSSQHTQQTGPQDTFLIGGHLQADAILPEVVVMHSDRLSSM